MALIEVDTDVFYDTELQWWEQSAECITMGENAMQDAPKSINNESLGDHVRMISGVWESATNTGVFDLQVQRAYLYSISNPAFLTKSQQDTITVTEIV